MSDSPIQPIGARSCGNVQPLQGVFNLKAIDAKRMVGRSDDFADMLSVPMESRRSPRLESPIRNVTYGGNGWSR